MPLVLLPETKFNKYLSKINKNILTFDSAYAIVTIQRAKRSIRMRGQRDGCRMSREVIILKVKNIAEKKKLLTFWTKILLDFMFYCGIVVTATLPFSIKWVGKYFPRLLDNYQEIVIIYFVLGVAALVLIGELRKMFRTVLAENCFVAENVASLRKMGNWSFFIAGMSVLRSIVYLTTAMVVVVFVFIIAGLFSKVLALVFEEAVRYKEENDLTI